MGLSELEILDDSPLIKKSKVKKQDSQKQK
jgi:hypothetical protein